MNMHKLMIGLASFLTASTITGLATANRAQTVPQAPPAEISQQEYDSHHSGKTPTPASSQKQAVQVDQHFIEMMIPHHQDAVAMADLALTRAKHPEVKQLAQAIKQDQTREINQMRAWYKQWFGKAVPATSTDSMMGGQGMMQGSGMMGSGSMINSQTMMGSGTMSMNNARGMHTDLNALKTAKDFDLEFIRQMIPHHRMAVMMAQMLQNGTTRSEMEKLAQSIIKTQTAEINQMQQWYQTWSASRSTSSSKL